MPTSTNAKNQIDLLKELYDSKLESQEERILREFMNQCAKLHGLPETPEPCFFGVNRSAYPIRLNSNPLLKLIPSDFKGVSIPIPLKYEK